MSESVDPKVRKEWNAYLDGRHRSVTRAASATLPRMPRVVSACLACHRPRSSRSPGLCGRCYLDAELAAIYAEVGLTEPTRLPAPTSHRPGSPGKLAVLEQRAKGGFKLWHPGDAV